MTGEELRKARIELGKLWGWDRPPFAAELGRILTNSSDDPGECIRDHERARDKPIPWALAAAVQMLLRGSLPPGGLGAAKPPKPEAVAA